MVMTKYTGLQKVLEAFSLAVLAGGLVYTFVERNGFDISSDSGGRIVVSLLTGVLLYLILTVFSTYPETTNIKTTKKLVARPEAMLKRTRTFVLIAKVILMFLLTAVVFILL